MAQPERLSSLEAVHAACWQQLAAAATERGHAWRQVAVATVATVSGDGADQIPQAELRTVVLREVDVGARALLFFTDARSPKVAQMQAQPQASLLVWSPALGWQLRLKARLQVATSGLAVTSRWARLQMSPAAQDYLSPLPPGAPLQAPPEAGTPPAAPPDRGTRNHFAVVTATVLQIDWLELHAQGHRRAAFDAQGQGRWLTP